MMVMDIDGMKIMNNGLHLVSIETAIKLLRPEAKFELNNMIFTRWEHSQDPPSWDEINIMMSKIQEFVEANPEVANDVVVI